MTRQERISRTAELFHEALTQTPDRQSAFLSEACAGDEDLFRKVKELLEAYAEVATSYSASSSGLKLTPFVLDPDTLIALGERYEDIKFVGRGGMGVVFRARDREIEKVLALKLLNPSLAHDELVIERFKNEGRLALDVTHRNVCRTYSLERFNRTILISMEYVEGETLRSILDRVKGVSVPQGLVWSQEICEALGAAHEKKIVHRDLKPENIMVDREGHIKVMDFGIAHSNQPHQTGPGTIIGTPRYMSPEQIEGKVVEATTDIYSLGLVLSELFTGAQSQPEHLTAARQANPYLPAHIDHAIRRCLDQNPKHRFQTVNELKMALITDWDVTGRERAPARFVRKRRTMVSLVVTLCAVLAALVMGAVYVVQRNRPPAAAMHQDDEINDLAFNPSGHLLASASDDRTVVLWDAANQRKIRILAGHIGAVTCVAFSSNGHWLASGSADKTMKIWEVETGRLAYTLNDSKTITNVAFSPNGHWLASTGDEFVKLWDVQANRVVHVLRHNDAVGALTFSPDGHLLASGSTDKTVRVWEVETGHIVGGPLHHDDEVKALTFSPDGQLLASGSLDKTIKLWQLGTWLPVQTLWHGAHLSNLAFNLDGSQLMSISDDGKLKVWEAPTWRESASLMVDEHGDTTSPWAFSPDGRLLAVGTMDGAINLHSVRALTAHK